jgi:hypothetical protein
MATITAHQALTIFSWFALAALLFMLLLIGRFYRNVTGEHTRFWMFVLPIIFFGLASARYAFIDQAIGSDPLGDTLWLMGGLLLAGICIYLYNLMTAGR